MQLSALSLAITRLGRVPAYSPLALFTGTTQGAWYDPSDITTLYRDAAGTQPVTAVEQPVGLMLDKSKNGVGTNGAKRVNLLTKTEDFSDAVWLKNQATVSATNITAPNGTPTADRVTATGSAAYAVHVVNNLANTPCVFSASISKGTSFTISVDNGISIGRGVTFDGATGAFVTFNTLGAGYTVSAYSCITHPSDSNYWLASMTVTPNAGTNNVAVWINTAKTSSYASGISTTGDTLVVWGADLRLASEASTLPTYQKITDTWYNTLPGNHAFNSSGNSANFPVLSARYNLLTKTEDFSSDWTLLDASFTGFVTNPIGGSNARKVNFGATYGALRWTYLPFPPGVNGKYSLYVRKPTGSTATAIRLTTNNGSSWGTGMSQKFILTSQWTAISFTGIVQTGDNRAHILIGTPDVNGSSDADCVGEIEIWGADLRVSNDALNQPAYQRVNTATDYDTVGFKPYLRFNGTNQWLQTNSIDFTYTDKMFVSAGVRKLVDSPAYGTFLELSGDWGANSGKFVIYAPNENALQRYGFGLRGTSNAGYSPQTFATPITNVISSLMDIGAANQNEELIPRINGVIHQENSNATSAGTGVFSNNPIYIGARAGSSLWFNGRLYQMVVAGKQASAAEITSTETYINQKTGAF